MKKAVCIVTADHLLAIEKIFSKYPKEGKKSALREILAKFLPEKISFQNHVRFMKEVACSYDVPVHYLMEIARNDLGYSYEESGVAHHIEVCLSLPCLLRGGGDVMKACEKWLGLPCGSKTVDGRFLLDKKLCFNRCSKGPTVKINDHIQEELTPTKMVFWLQGLGSEDKASAPMTSTKVRMPYTTLGEKE